MPIFSQIATSNMLQYSNVLSKTMLSKYLYLLQC